MKPLRIALLGFGTVGGGVYRIISQRKEDLAQQSGRIPEIKKILVQDLTKTRAIAVPRGLLTTDFSEISEDPEIDLIVEVMGGVTPALDYLRQSIERGRHIVTANKELLAKHGTELLKLADQNKVHFHFEASVGGGIPVIKALRESLAANEITKLMGIINGTTNYILTKMKEEKKTLEAALLEAQALGYAESDPTNDVDGFDVAYKLLTLGNIAFRSKLDLGKINIEGIRKITLTDLEFGEQLGYTLKLLAIAKNTEKGIEARVHPTFIPQDHPLASVNDVFNAIYLEGDSVGELMFYGRGAGDLPTGSAVCSDILDVARDSGAKRACSWFYKKDQLSMDQTVTKYYVRISVEDRPGVLARISAAFGKNGVSIRSVIQEGRGEPVPLVFVTHEVSEAKFKNSIGEISKLECVFQIDNIIRVEEE